MFGRRLVGAGAACLVGLSAGKSPALSFGSIQKVGASFWGSAKESQPSVALPDSFFELTAKKIDGTEMEFEELQENAVIMVTNVATF
jgi:hypothetical protein